MAIIKYRDGAIPKLLLTGYWHRENSLVPGERGQCAMRGQKNDGHYSKWCVGENGYVEQNIIIMMNLSDIVDISNIDKITVTIQLSQDAQLLLGLAIRRNINSTRRQRGSSNHTPLDHGIAATFRSIIATVIFVRWWQKLAQSKAHNPRHQLKWPITDCGSNNVLKMAVLLAPWNISRDLMRPAEANWKLSYWLI